MNDWSYLILIGALLTLAALMIYARIVSRSREKSLHHTPAEYSGSEFTELSFDQSAESRDTPIEEDPVTVELKAEPSAEENSIGDDEEYLDELQEAAAGLAVLMRSSPVANRANPVVFAPDSESAQEEACAEAVETEEASEQIDGLASSEDTLEADVSPVVTNESEIAREDEQTVLSLLGEDVNDQFLKIDTDLDELEELVLSIEEGIALLDIDLAGVDSAVSETMTEAA
tara:strand:- start:2834 stop:3523 length:690 start_codon:yes stop_codon:yes gene_type:complete